ncbi:MAG: hypothetical protein KDA28_14165, partial [Phycisphaerales bacterium]|nr:hypothetical protein [Phycisphaerales bacterium]
MKRVLLLETIADEAHDLLATSVETVLAPDPRDATDVARETDPHAIVTRGKGLVVPPVVDACPNLVAVARCGVGLDNVDVAHCTARDVKVLNLPGSNADTIAEHAMMLVLALTRGLVQWANAVCDGRWADRGAFAHDEVRGKVIGIVGMGAIGSRVARLADAFGMTVLYTDLRDRGVHERVALDALLERADVVTLHCQLDETTRGLFDQDAFARMKPGAILVNTARGEILDPHALRSALDRLGGFGADVLDQEPPDPQDPLLAHPNVVLTPHVGSLTARTYVEMCVRSVQNVL